jgi:hypothetical protein
MMSVLQGGIYFLLVVVWFVGRLLTVPVTQTTKQVRRLSYIVLSQALSWHWLQELRKTTKILGQGFWCPKWVPDRAPPQYKSQRYRLPTGLASFLIKDTEIRPIITEDRVRSQASPCEVYDWRSGTGAGFSPNTSGFPTKYRTTSAPFSPLYPYNLSKWQSG